MSAIKWSANVGPTVDQHIHMRTNLLISRWLSNVSPTLAQRGDSLPEFNKNQNEYDSISLIFISNLYIIHQVQRKEKRCK